MKLHPRVTTLAVSTAAALTAFATPAMAADLTVDDDRRQCKNAEFTQIQPAVAAAQPGDTIRVCAGEYAGDVQVDKPLTLLGAMRGNAQQRAERSDLEKESVVRNEGLVFFTSAGFNVIASDVRIEGFTVIGTPASTSYPSPGIYLRTGSGRIITDNVLRENRLGAYLEGAQSDSELERNAFVGNRANPNTGGQPTGGVFAAGGQVNDLGIENNYFSGNGQFSINLGGGSAGGIDIEHNLAEDERGTFVVLFNQATDVDVKHNRAVRLGASGVFLGGLGSDGVEIAYNDFSGSGVNTNGSGVRATGVTPFTSLVIEHNTFELFRFDGVSLNRTTNSLVAHNQLDDNTQSGVRLQDADAGLLLDNSTEGNGKDGINAEAQSTGNTIERNRAEGQRGARLP